MIKVLWGYLAVIVVLTGLNLYRKISRDRNVTVTVSPPSIKIEPPLKVGDCALWILEKEEWEKEEDPTFRVLQVGKNKYLMEYLTPKEMAGHITDLIFMGVADLKKIDCP